MLILGAFIILSPIYNTDMATPVWGTLAKTQDDPTTIDQEIDAKILAHNEDPTAHMASGQSIEVHRTNSIIDHPAGSVLADKVSNTEMLLSGLFDNLTPWAQTGTVATDKFPLLGLYVEDGSVPSSTAEITIESPANFLNHAYDMTFLVVMDTQLESGKPFDAFFGIGDGFGTDFGGFGFVVNAGVLKAASCDEHTNRFSDPIAVDWSIPHVYRAQISHTDNAIVYFVDGTQVAQLAIFDDSIDGDSGPGFGIKAGADNDGYTYFSGLQVARSLTLP